MRSILSDETLGHQAPLSVAIQGSPLTLFAKLRVSEFPQWPL
jgi:hypothetical protein